MLISKYGERNKPKMRKLLTPTPKVEAGEQRLLSWRLREVGVRDNDFLPRYKNEPQGSSDGVLGFNTFFDSFYIVLASPIHSGMVTIEIKLTIATV